MLEGRPAPEIPSIITWKNSEPLRLSDIRGKCVLLEFWGYWCGPCVHRMPKLFELHDKYHDQGLVIIGVHVDLDQENSDQRVDTVTKLDEQLIETRKSLWKDRDIPFAVALVAGNPTAFGDGIVGKASSPAAAAYGILSYPTQVLINRKGNVVRKFHPNEDGIKLLEKTLRER